jgi:hypothetical protein
MAIHRHLTYAQSLFWEKFGRNSRGTPLIPKQILNELWGRLNPHQITFRAALLLYFWTIRALEVSIKRVPLNSNEVTQFGWSDEVTLATD